MAATDKARTAMLEPITEAGGIGPSLSSLSAL